MTEQELIEKIEKASNGDWKRFYQELCRLCNRQF